MEQQAYIDLQDVTLSYGEEGAEQTLALEHTTLKVAKGEFIAVVGTSGCGKSSLMKLVTGLIPPTSGKLAVNGKTVTRPIQGVGMAFQSSTLMPWRNTLGNIMLPLEIVEPYKRRLRQDRKQHIEKAEVLLASVGLKGLGKKFPWELSGGMQQRASLCRALIHSPDLLMLDEPFGALDAFTREELWDVMQNLWLDRRFTAILVTHDLREAVYLADTVYVMSARPGRILHAKRVDIPRPRSLQTSFEPRFVDIVQELREHIGHEHSR